jgi:hypothetical protein
MTMLKFNGRKAAVRMFAFVLPGVTLFLSSTSASALGSYFGVHCTRQYQNSWTEDLGQYAWQLCDRFRWQLDNSDYDWFHYNLYNKQYYWHDSGDQEAYALEDTDLFFALTHGGITDTNAAWAMWNADINIRWAWSRQMRLGDEGWQQKIFVTYSCDTQYWDDPAKVVSRWVPIFAGGLKYALGSDNTLNVGYTTSECGEEFAIGLQANETLLTAWKTGTDDNYYTQHPSGMATGTDANDCNNRLHGLSWNNFSTAPTLRDWQIGYLCQQAYSL